jgi:hypothetical protein
MGWVVNATPLPLYPQETPGTQCTGWMGLRARWTGVENPPPNGNLLTVQPVASRYTH